MIRGIGPLDYAEKQIRTVFAGEHEDALEDATVWAVQTLAAAGLDPAAQPLRAMRVLRRRRRGLGLVAARYLVEAAAGRAPRESRRGTHQPRR